MTPHNMSAADPGTPTLRTMLAPAPAVPVDTALGYCGICKDWFEYLIDPAAKSEPRCPLCGFRHGEV